MRRRTSRSPARASYVVATKSSLPAGAGTAIEHVRGVPVAPPQAAEPDEMSVSDWPMIVLPPCAYTLKSMPLVDGETNFGRRTPLDEPRPAVVPPMITLILTDSGVPGTFVTGVSVRGVVIAPPPPPPHPPKNAAASATASNLRNELFQSRSSERASAGTHRRSVAKNGEPQSSPTPPCNMPQAPSLDPNRRLLYPCG